MAKKLPRSQRIKQPGEPIDPIMHPGMAKRMENLKKGQDFMPKPIAEAVKEYANIKEIASVVGPKVFNVLVSLATESESEDIRLRASCYLVDKIWGRDPQIIKLEGNLEIKHGIIMLPAPPQIINPIEIDIDGSLKLPDINEDNNE